VSKIRKIYPYVAITLVLVLSLAACQPAELAVDPADLTAIPAQALEADDDVFSGVFPPENNEILDMEGAITTTSGLQFLEMIPSDGPNPQDGDIVNMNFIAALPDGTEFGNSYTQGGPIEVIVGRNQLLPGWEEGVKLMTVGSTARMVLPPDLAFGPEGYSGVVPPDSQIILVVEIMSIEKPPVPQQVSDNQLSATESGLKFYDISVGDGDAALDGLLVSTHFSIWVKEGSEFKFISASEGEFPFSFEIGLGDMVFPGWEEGTTNMKVGGKRYLEIPPELGLGESGGGDIPPNAILVMEIELTEVKEPVKMTEIDPGEYTTTETGLQYFDLVEGEGATPETGQMVVVHYTGWLEDGTKFDSSLDRGEPFTFALDFGMVIDGWVEGVSTMKVGGVRQLVIPSELGYGDAGAPPTIPPGATLIFEVELLNIEAGE